MPVLITPVWRHVTPANHPCLQQSRHESSGPDLGSPEKALKCYGRPSLAECDSLSRRRDDQSFRFAEAQYQLMKDPPPPRDARTIVHLYREPISIHGPTLNVFWQQHLIPSRQDPVRVTKYAIYQKSISTNGVPAAEQGRRNK